MDLTNPCDTFTTIINLILGGHLTGCGASTIGGALLCAIIASNARICSIIYISVFLVSALSLVKCAFSTARTLCALANCAVFNNQLVLLLVDAGRFLYLDATSFDPKERPSFSFVLSIRSDLILSDKSNPFTTMLVS